MCSGAPGCVCRACYPSGWEMGDETVRIDAAVMTRMRDADVRRALHAKVLADHHDDPNTRVLDELSLWYGSARVDIAVVNGFLHGYEIKSDRDTLERLEGQSQVYNAVLDRTTIVVGAKHLEKVLAVVPGWWGVKLARQGPRRAVHFDTVRGPHLNPTIDPVKVAALLWNDELTEILAERGAARGVRGKSRHAMCERLVEVLSLTDLRAVVRARLKGRTTWRADPLRTRCGGSSPPFA